MDKNTPHIIVDVVVFFRRTSCLSSDHLQATEGGGLHSVTLAAGMACGFQGDGPVDQRGYQQHPIHALTLLFECLLNGVCMLSFFNVFWRLTLLCTGQAEV